MNHYKYIIVGGGMTADAAVKGIRELDSEGSIAVISREAHPPYARPPLTKGLWKGAPEEKIWKNTQQLPNLTLLLNASVLSINKDNSVSFDTGEKLYYDKLLLATGGEPRKFSFDGENIIYYRTFDDYKKLRELAETAEKFAVVGGGFIGSEIAAALAMNGKKVTMIFPSKYIGEKMFPKEIAEYITNYYGEKGVELVPKDTVKDIRNQDGTEVITTERGQTIPVNAVVIG
ncbi:MAG TPA: FAD/NAD(P)-binding oxidoreductase, partial [Ignavibacteria bacterium]